MTHDEYCIKVCGGKCCTLYPAGKAPIRCPRLAKDGSCSVYKERYPANEPTPRLVQVGTVLGKPFMCGMIEDVLASGAMPKSIQDQCCYAHPELLNEK